jgi:hypothetical protein
MYASLGTRPDISYAVTTVSRFSSNPGQAHWDAVRRIYRYVLGTTTLKLTYGGVESALTGYADADGSMGKDRRAVSGYAFLIDGGAVLWSSKRQDIILLSTTESEYVAATHTAKRHYGFVPSLARYSHHLRSLSPFSPTINQPLHSPKTTNITPEPNISIFVFILFAG